MILLVRLLLVSLNIRLQNVSRSNPKIISSDFSKSTVVSISNIAITSISLLSSMSQLSFAVIYLIANKDYLFKKNVVEAYDSTSSNPPKNKSN